MAKTADQIATELASSINQTDNTIDISRGPVPALYIRPQSGQLADVASAAEGLRQLFTLQFGDTVTDAEAQQALANYASSPGTGSNSKHVQYFMRFTRPTADITVTAGNLISNVDGSLVYRTLNTVTMKASAASTYYNPSRNSYEVSVVVEALGTGTQYELAPLLVNTLLTPIPGIDATENRTQSQGGTEAEDVSSQTVRLQTALQGLNYGAPNGIKSRLMNQFPDAITDVAVIQPFDEEFKRMIVGSALDIYLIGNQTATFTQTTVASFGQTQVQLANVPVLDITSVTVNGIGASNYVLLPDSSPETGYSLDSVDYAVFDSPFATGDQIVIQYDYNALLNNVFVNYFGATEANLFNVDILTRSPFPVSPKVTMSVRVLSSYDADTVGNQILNYLATTFTPTTFQSVVYPEILRQTILSTIPGIQSLSITTFKRNSGALAEVEPIYLKKNENFLYDSSLVTLKVA